jgi:hypothetical protein
MEVAFVGGVLPQFYFVALVDPVHPGYCESVAFLSVVFVAHWLHVCDGVWIPT